MADNPVLSQITLPSGTTYDLKDAQARADIVSIWSAISGGVTFLGVTTTQISDGDTTNPIIIDGQSITATKGAIVVYISGNTSNEYLWDGTHWNGIGDMTVFGALAYKSSATATYTPVGTVSQPTFTGSSSSVTLTIEADASGNYTPAGTVSQPTFTGSSTTSTGTFTPSGSVTLTNSNQTATVAPAPSGEATYTPAGSVSAPTISVDSAGATTTIKNPTAATVATAVNAVAPGGTAPSNAITYYSVSGETLSLYQLGYTTGDSITTENVTVKTGDASYTASAPSFTGTGARLVTDNISVPSSASFSGTEGNISVSGTPTGTVSQPTFSGTKVAISGTVTPTGTVSQPTFTGTEGTITVS